MFQVHALDIDVGVCPELEIKGDGAVCGCVHNSGLTACNKEKRSMRGLL